MRTLTRVGLANGKPATVKCSRDAAIGKPKYMAAGQESSPFPFSCRTTFCAGNEVFGSVCLLGLTEHLCKLENVPSIQSSYCRIYSTH